MGTGIVKDLKVKLASLTAGAALLGAALPQLNAGEPVRLDFEANRIGDTTYLKLSSQAEGVQVLQVSPDLKNWATVLNVMGSYSVDTSLRTTALSSQQVAEVLQKTGGRSPVALHELKVAAMDGVTKLIQELILAPDATYLRVSLPEGVASAKVGVSVKGEAPARVVDLIKDETDRRSFSFRFEAVTAEKTAESLRQSGGSPGNVDKAFFRLVVNP